ncbi:alpha/beta hydrolase [Hyalangium sp.]|uniref:alpha/beta fold hydrolase n=1 Tax=Hyalangium sp. TaxID=2028555 RepID=UPI002D5CC11E|nr:alpha/beta hydrolase [Hyalangium sp.]HYH97058.1 alpha/beta hydrolase [Hyalangium sp.]
MQHSYADINGIRMHYVTHGAGEPILFLHGAPEYWGVWKPLMKEFSKDHQVIAPDMRGYNLTSQPKDFEQYSIHHLVGDIRGLADHLGLRKLTLVGHDWGALVAWAFSLYHPEYVRRLVSISMTHPALFDRELRENPQQQQISQYMLLFQAPDAGTTLTGDDFAFQRQNVFVEAGRPGSALTEEDVAEWFQSWKTGGLTGSFNYYRAMKLGPPNGQFPGGSTILEGLPPEKWKVSFPVLVVRGDGDYYVVRSGLDGLEKLAPDLTVQEIPDATHWVIMQKPDAVGLRIREFMSTHG